MTLRVLREGTIAVLLWYGSFIQCAPMQGAWSDSYEGQWFHSVGYFGGKLHYYQII